MFQETFAVRYSVIQIGQVPKTIFLRWVDSADFHGSGKINPVQFHHYDVQQKNLEVNGQSFPIKPYMMDFKKGMSLEGYDGLLNTLGRKCNPYEEFCVTRKKYASGCTVFGFDSTPG